MRNSRLADLNFRELIDYGGHPVVQNSYTQDRQPRYCVSCEESGVLGRVGGRLDLMSHGCDSNDFERILGPMPRDTAAEPRAVLFLLEDPGGDKGNGAPVPFQGFRKEPPIYHYYWTPNIGFWPTRAAEFGGNFYGPYFAYLMRRHQLLEVYITNLVKCRWVGPKGGKSPIVDHCTSRFLVREITLFAPQIVLFFGKAARRGADALLARLAPRCRSKQLLHPSYISNRCQVHRSTQEDCIRINDERIHEVLGRVTRPLQPPGAAGG